MGRLWPRTQLDITHSQIWRLYLETRDVHFGAFSVPLLGDSIPISFINVYILGGFKSHMFYFSLL